MLEHSFSACDEKCCASNIFLVCHFEILSFTQNVLLTCETNIFILYRCSCKCLFIYFYLYNVEIITVKRKTFEPNFLKLSPNPMFDILF